MKVEKIDLIWAAVSMIIVGVSYRRGELIKGLLLIYLLMVLVFAWHIYKILRRLKGSVPVYGTIVDYHESKIGKHSGWYPVVRYSTETGREITSVYTVEEKEQRYETGDEELICYSPDDPMFFYFSNRKEELYRDYVRFIVYGGAVSAILLLLLAAK
ncbi:MAG: DUF3592 domain-containing protein [Ruminococcus sp.]|nr:DUF3592 domain-containing protein [Ruminococcus sp.]